jgi:hypothetical protein
MSHWSIKLPIRGPNAPLADLIADAFSFKAEERDVVHELVSQAILSSCRDDRRPSRPPQRRFGRRAPNHPRQRLRGGGPRVRDRDR